MGSLFISWPQPTHEISFGRWSNSYQRYQLVISLVSDIFPKRGTRDISSMLCPCQCFQGMVSRKTDSYTLNVVILTHKKRKNGTLIASLVGDVSFSCYHFKFWFMKSLKDLFRVASNLVHSVECSKIC